jgi:hypothetical protein
MLRTVSICWEARFAAIERFRFRDHDAEDEQRHHHLDHGEARLVAATARGATHPVE